MSRDVFLSYSSKDKTAADTICAELEQRGINCWMAPRDIIPGIAWAESIIDALDAARVIVLVLSESANASVQIHREVERAVHKNVPVLPVRIENVLPSKAMEYFISSHHWFDAIDPPLVQHMERLAQGVQALLSRPGERKPARRKKAIKPAAPAASAPPSAPTAHTPEPRPPAAAAPASTAPPATLGNYDLGQVLGMGRFGSTVYAGTHRLMGHAVAVRMLRADARSDRNAVRERFLKEARSLQVQHPNIIHVRDFGEQDDVMYIVTDLLAGCSLGEMLASEGTLPIPTLRRFVAELADATVVVHGKGGLISGLHPEIVRVVRENGDERLAISSAGVHTAQDILSTMNEAALRGQASTNELSYVAPELLTGKSADAKTDVFTIGALAYHMAAGRPPFRANSFPELLGTMLGSSPVNVETLRPELGALAPVIMRCIERDPAARYDTAAAVLEAWKAAQA
jgi:hypothetical protein